MQPIPILLADADDLIRQCLRRAVEDDPTLRIGWEADNGLQALLLAQQHQPLLILIDVQMPRMDGIEVTRILRQRHQQMRIVVMGIYDQHHDQALAAGADGFVIKDCGGDTLRDMICRLLQTKEPFYHSEETIDGTSNRRHYD